MKSINNIYKVYCLTDQFFQDKEDRARTDKTRQKWFDKRSLNDQAYFVLIFAQFEDFINKQCDDLIKSKKRSPKWAYRRLWDSVDVDNLSFKKCVALLTDKGENDFREIIDLYKIRCEIAHGKGYGPILVHTETAKIKELVKKIKKG